MLTQLLFIFVVLLHFHALYAEAESTPLSKPITSDAQLPSSKFTKRKAQLVEDIIFKTDVSGFQRTNECPMDLELVWTNQLDAGVYGSSIVDNILSDGTKQVVVPAFHRDISVLDNDGHFLPGYPIPVQQDAHFHASPLLYDFNNDGVKDQIWASVNAEIFIINGDATFGKSLLRKPIHIPKLRIRKNWYNGLTEFEKKEAKEKDKQKDEEEEVPPVSTPMPTPNNIDNDDDAEPIGPQLGDGLTQDAIDSFSLFTDTKGLLYSEDDDEHTYPIEDRHVWVDAHILATPTLVDLNDDGFSDIILSVSYFYDEEDFEAQPHLFRHLGNDVNIRKYVAGGLVAYDMKNDKMIWQEHLDLTTDETSLRAYIYSSPTVVDLDGDGGLEVIVGTSLGFIYCLRAKTGELLEGYPLIMSEIEGQIAVEDLNGDGDLEMVAVDSFGSVFCFNKDGKEVWERSISGFGAQAASFGDIDGDGVIDVVVGTLTGHVWALRGDTGEVLEHFPVKTNGRIISPITLVNLDVDVGVHRPGLHAIFPSFDGHVYVVDGRTGCTNKLDIGEHSYSQVVVDDLLNNGKMDILVTTMSGNIYCFATDSKYDRLKAWSGQNHGSNTFSSQHNFHGITLSPQCRQHMDIMGSTMRLEFEIVDQRPSTLAKKGPARKYSVKVLYGQNILFEKIYTEAGTYQEDISSLDVPRRVSLTLQMTNEHGQVFFDSFVLGFNVQFYRTIKWLLVAPLVGMAGVLLFVTQSGPSLPG